jgi:glycosyltransferase involved in cell wall biosynthesis
LNQQTASNAGLPAGGAETARRLAVVMPAFNEEGHIVEQIQSVQEVLADTNWQFEIVVVDDGSTDETCERAKGTGVSVIKHRRNYGYGAALKHGIGKTSAPWILIIDADGTYPVEAIPELLGRADDNEMVVGARTGKTVEIPLVRRPAKWFLRVLASFLSGRKLPDINSGLRLMRRDLVERYQHLLPSGFSFTTTITLAAACNDHDLEYVEIDYLKRFGRSSIRAWHAYEFLLLTLRTIVFFNPLKVFMPLGGILALAGIVKFIYDISRNNLSESAVLAFLAALVIWVLGLLADQNARIAMNR